jgi:hypothetical protein
MRTLPLLPIAALVALAWLASSPAAQPQALEVREEVAAQAGKQLVEAYQNERPFGTPLPEHLWLVGEDGSVQFLHFDKPLPEATRLLYVGYGVKGRWCAEDQERIEKAAGKGFTHFHRTAKVRTAEAGHGGSTPGEEGYWLKHVAVAEFDMPWGHVGHGVDMKFMPTTAPKCGS